MIRASVLDGAFQDRAIEGLIRDLDAALSRDEIRISHLAAAERMVIADGIGFYRLGSTAWATPKEISANLRADFLAAYEADGRADDPVLRMAIASRSPVHSLVVERKSWDGCASRHVLGDAGLRHSMSRERGELRLPCSRVEVGLPAKRRDLMHAIHAIHDVK
jgi:hypothetical protein